MILAAFSIILFACFAGALLWQLAVHALPLWCGALVAIWVHGAGWSLMAAFGAGLAGAAATLVMGYWLVAVAQSPLARAALGAVFGLPTGVAGYHAATGIARAFGVAGWEQIFLALFAAAILGATGWGGVLRASQQPRPAWPGGAWSGAVSRRSSDWPRLVT